jgi:ComEC/Rec2-related protein
MTLGWRTAFTGDIGDPFLRAGTMHLFAIDGLRIALIAGMLVALLRVLQVSRAWCGLIAIPAIWFYTAATGWESSAIRASVMMTIVLGGWALKRPGDLLNSLAAAAFIILLWEPRQLFEASFQLSFCVMLVIGLLLPRMNKISDELLRHDPLAAGRFDSQMAARLDLNFQNSRALFFAFTCRVARLDSVERALFSFVQPGFAAGKFDRRAARHARADEQSRRVDLRRVVSVGDGTVQPRRVVFHVRDDGCERMVHENSRLLFLCAAPSWILIAIYYAARRHFGRLAEDRREGKSSLRRF